MAVCGASSATAEGLPSLTLLPRIRCPRGSLSPPGTPRSQQPNPRTPRGRQSWISAGAAYKLLVSTPQHSPATSSKPRALLQRHGDLSSGPLLSHSSAALFALSSLSTPPSHRLFHDNPRFPLPTALHSPCQQSRPRNSTSAAAPSLTFRVSSAIFQNRSEQHSPRSADMKVHCSEGNPSADALPADVDARLEASDSANEDILLFFYQMDLTSRLQRALNLDQYEPAQKLREKIAEVEEEIGRLRDARLGGTSAKEEAQDKGITLLALKAELSRAVEEEQYSLAAELRNKVTAMEAEALAASAAALVAKNRTFAFRLGQRLRHKQHGYLGLVAGMDPVCCETKEWREAQGLSTQLQTQPFYQILLDFETGLGFPVAYVPESRLEALEEPIKDPFTHPYVYLLFYGMDKKGDYIPSQQLREKYNAPRYEVPLEDEDSNEDGKES